MGDTLAEAASSIQGIIWDLELKRWVGERGTENAKCKMQTGREGPDTNSL